MQIDAFLFLLSSDACTISTFSNDVAEKRVEKAVS